MPQQYPLYVRAETVVWQHAARDADLTVELPGGLPMFFRQIPAGSFSMGSRGCDAREEPTHRVAITQEFFLGTFPVTQEQYQAVADVCTAIEDGDPSDFKGPRRPVEQVSWHEACAFCEWLTSAAALPAGWKAQLPTEAQWEYACRAGTETEFYSGDGEEALSDVGWFDENSEGQTHDVDQRMEYHPWGLFGMHGNVFEWCRDRWDELAYRGRPDGVRDPESTDDSQDKSQLRVLRGGSWLNSAYWCRSASRDWCVAGYRFWNFGFRVCLVRSPAESQKRSGGGAGARETK